MAQGYRRIIETVQSRVLSHSSYCQVVMLTRRSQDLDPHVFFLLNIGDEFKLKTCTEKKRKNPRNWVWYVML